MTPRAPEERRGSAQYREQQALRQKLPDDLHSPRAERQAHRDLLAPSSGARDEQTRNIGTGDQQHQSDHHHEHLERLGGVLAKRGGDFDLH